MQKIYGKKKQPKFCLEIDDNILIGEVDKKGKFLRIAVGNDNEGAEFTLASLHDISVFRDFVRRAERFLKDSVRVKK